MYRIPYYLTLIFAYLFSLLPKKIHYLISDFSACLLRDVIKYRLDVIIVNIARSFPEKKYDEIKLIVDKFYHNFTDIFFEMIWSVSRSISKWRDNLETYGLDIVNSAYKRNGSAMIVMGHFANWEQMLAIDMSPSGYRNEDLRIVYKKLSSQFSDFMIQWVRKRHSEAALVEMNEIARYMLKHRDEKLCYIFIADQVPLPGSKFQTKFLNQPTRFFEGPEQLSRKLNIPVIFLKAKRVGRGKYNAKFVSITENPSSLEEGEITNRFASLLEEEIIQSPADWLWSHRRWKRDN